MNDFFCNSFICTYIYLVILNLLIFSIFIKKYKKCFLMIALALFVIDISYLMLLGFNLEKCAIVCGVCVILTLISIKEGRDNEL